MSEMYLKGNHFGPCCSNLTNFPLNTGTLACSGRKEHGASCGNMLFVVESGPRPKPPYVTFENWLWALLGEPPTLKALPVNCNLTEVKDLPPSPLTSQPRPCIYLQTSGTFLHSETSPRSWLLWFPGTSSLLKVLLEHILYFDPGPFHL